MTDINAAIDVTDLTVAYRDKPVLWDVDFSVPAGNLLAIVGPNGAGKTTLIKSILGLVKPATAPSGGLCAAAGQRRLGLPHQRAGCGDDGALWRARLDQASRPA